LQISTGNYVENGHPAVLLGSPSSLVFAVFGGDFCDEHFSFVLGGDFCGVTDEAAFVSFLKCAGGRYARNNREKVTLAPKNQIFEVGRQTDIKTEKAA
jgi:hypothetical protein